MSGAVELGTASILRGVSVRRGDIVVLTLPRGADGATRLVRQVLRALARSHLEARPLPQPAPSGDAG